MADAAQTVVPSTEKAEVVAQEDGQPDIRDEIHNAATKVEDALKEFEAVIANVIAQTIDTQDAGKAALFEDQRMRSEVVFDMYEREKKVFMKTAFSVLSTTSLVTFADKLVLRALKEKITLRRKLQKGK